MSDNPYGKLIKRYAKAYRNKSKKTIQDEVNVIWRDINNRSDFSELYSTKLSELEEKSREYEARQRNFWLSAFKRKSSAQNEKSTTTVETESSAIETDSTIAENESTVVATDSTVVGSETLGETSAALPVSTEPDLTKVELKSQATHPTPRQNSISRELDVLNSDISALYTRKSFGLLSVEQTRDLSSKEHKKTKLQKLLRKTINDQKRARIVRKKQKEKVKKILEQHPEYIKEVKLHKRVGRPRLEEDQPLLLQAICDIALHGSAAHERRQAEVYRSIKTLDQLQAEMLKKGFELSRSALYLRLIPKRSLSEEGKRHVTTVPVKLMKPQNDHHMNHSDGKFCTSTLRSLDELASFAGPNEVAFISQDDKAKVAIGVTAAHKQAPIIMHLEYKVSLPDHDWVIAARHKLTPSVYCGIEIQKNGFGNPEAVGYTGPTYIAMRSGKISNFHSNKWIQLLFSNSRKALIVNSTISWLR